MALLLTALSDPPGLFPRAFLGYVALASTATASVSMPGLATWQRKGKGLGDGRVLDRAMARRPCWFAILRGAIDRSDEFRSEAHSEKCLLAHETNLRCDRSPQELLDRAAGELDQPIPYGLDYQSAVAEHPQFERDELCLDLVSCAIPPIVDSCQRREEHSFERQERLAGELVDCRPSPTTARDSRNRQNRGAVHDSTPLPPDAVTVEVADTYRRALATYRSDPPAWRAPRRGDRRRQGP